MAITSETRVYTALFTETMDDHRPELIDQIYASIPLLFFMRSRGRGRDRGGGRGIRFQNGGAKIRINLLHQKGGNAKSYSRFEPLTVNATDEITAGIEVMRQLSTTVGISGEEMDQNQGEAAKRDLLSDKLMAARMELQELLETQLMQGDASGIRMIAGNSGKDMNPLGFLIQKDPTASDTIHEIQQSTASNSWWRNRASVAAATDWFGHKKEMTSLYNTCSRGSSNDHPDLIISDQNYFEFYEAILAQQQRYGNYGDDGAASTGFETMKFKGAMMFWSEFMPNLGNTSGDTVSTSQSASQAAAFFLNTRWLELVVSRKVNFANTPFVEPYDQDAIWSKILFRGQLTVLQRRKQGVHVGVDTALNA